MTSSQPETKVQSSNYLNTLTLWQCGASKQVNVAQTVEYFYSREKKSFKAIDAYICLKVKMPSYFIQKILDNLVFNLLLFLLTIIIVNFMLL